jgi:hypothetical protein
MKDKGPGTSSNPHGRKACPIISSTAIPAVDQPAALKNQHEAQPAGTKIRRRFTGETGRPEPDRAGDASQILQMCVLAEACLLATDV